MSKYAIVGAGFSGMSAAYYLAKKNHEVELFEAEKPGGLLMTKVENDEQLEFASDYFYCVTPAMLQLFYDLGLKDKVEYAAAKQKRYIVKDGHLMKSPSSKFSFLFNSFIFFPQKIKALKNIKKPLSAWKGMSLFEAGKNIFGETFADYFLSSWARNTHRAEMEELEFASVLPGIFNNLSLGIERAHNLSIEEKNKIADVSEEVQTNFKPGYYRIQGGMVHFMNTLKDELKKMNVKIHILKIKAIIMSGKQYQLKSGGQNIGPFDELWLSVNASEASTILKDFDKGLSRHLAELEFSGTTQVSYVFKKKDFSTSGQAVYFPKKEKIPALSISFPSNLFPTIVNKNNFLLKLFLAGDSHLFNDSEVEKMGLDILKRIFKIKASYVRANVSRIKPGYPKYKSGYQDWKSELSELSASHKGLKLIGWNYDAIAPEDVLLAILTRIKSL